MFAFAREGRHLPRHSSLAACPTSLPLWCPRVRRPPSFRAGWVDCAVKSYQAEGPSVFVRGLGTTLGRAFLVNGAIFSAYEMSHQLLTRQGNG